MPRSDQLAAPVSLMRQPRDDEIDVHGLTHIGKVRKQNQDHFLLASIHKRVEVHRTSLGDEHHLPFGNQRVAYLAMVADGVGGGEGGAEASATALENIMEYVVGGMDCYYRSDVNDEEFIHALQDAALRAHNAVLERARTYQVEGKMATTLTLYMSVWPRIYLLQVGDSRYYQLREGKLTQLSRDQTIAEELVRQGVFTRAVAARSGLANVLSSSIGGEQTAPVITRLEHNWGNVHLMCSDGLTKHVSDERIAERLSSMQSARQVSEQLLQDALDAGGTDNITIIVGRAVPKDLPSAL
jgi:serine/threonine protein phosphatase PrpC